MARVTRKQIADLKRAAGISGIGDCPECQDVYIVGMPGLWASAFRGPLVPTPDGLKRARSELLTHEEARRYFEGCPACGEPVKTYPIIMRGLKEGSDPPDPWPIEDWPEPPETKPKRGNLYDP